MIPTFLLDLKVAPPEVLYHYTSLDAATKIIEQGKLWATNLRFLNDASEYDHAVGMIRQRLQKLIAEQAPNQGRLYSLHTLLGTRPRFDHYVTSFTENGDDLSQWRGYSPSGQGACIGFRGNALAEYRNQANYEVTKQSARLLAPIIYVDTLGTTYFDEICSLCSPSQAFAIITNFASVFKHNAFKNEREWRAVAELNVDSAIPDELDFRLGGSTLLPYTSIDLNALAKQAIASVRIGPSPNIALSARSFELFLQARKKANIEVSLSSIPYRSL